MGTELVSSYPTYEIIEGVPVILLPPDEAVIHFNPSVLFQPKTWSFEALLDVFKDETLITP
jgi:hypothetical protein